MSAVTSRVSTSHQLYVSHVCSEGNYEGQEELSHSLNDGKQDGCVLCDLHGRHTLPVDEPTSYPGRV